MPPSEFDASQGWISSEQLPKTPHEELARSEAEAFLEYLFSAVAQRPRPLSLREGAGVARYLKALAWETPPGAARALLERLGEVLWGTLLQHAPFAMSRKPAVVAFLEKHASTYLAGFDVEVALKQVRTSNPPRQTTALPAPRLMSRKLAVSGSGSPWLSDDLSERSYAAYHALRQAGIHNARGRIAAVLNQCGLQTRARHGTLRGWGSYEVYERVKQYEARLKKWIPAGRGPSAVKQGRQSLVDRWIFAFHRKTE